MAATMARWSWCRRQLSSGRFRAILDEPNGQEDACGHGKENVQGMWARGLRSSPEMRPRRWRSSGVDKVEPPGCSARVGDVQEVRLGTWVKMVVVVHRMGV